MSAPGAQYHWNGLDLKVVNGKVFKFLHGEWVRSEITEQEILDFKLFVEQTTSIYFWPTFEIYKNG